MRGGSDELDARTSDAMRVILDLENDTPDALLEVLPGTTVPLWAQVRMEVAWMLTAERTGSVAVDKANTWSRWAEARRVAGGYLPTRWDAVRRARRHAVCFYVSGATLAARGDRARNWLVDDFAEEAGDAIVVQQRSLPSPLGAPQFRPTLSMDAATARSRWRSRGNAPAAGYVQALDQLLTAFAEMLGEPTEKFAGIRQRILRYERHRPFQLQELQSLLERVQPQVVIYDNASYTYNGESVGLIKDAGILVAEPQHGWIGPSHAAYNYGRVFEDDSLRRALPDELLTFGPYWSSSIRHPGKVTAIGKPHLERQTTAIPGTRPRQMLVVSSRTDPAATDAFVVELREAIGAEWSIVFRPHPGELAEAHLRYPRLTAHDAITTDRSPDVYESLKQTAVVIGEASTVLFEARAFGCRVIARDSDFADGVIGDAFGDRVRTAREVARRVSDIRGDETIAAAPDRDIWAPRPVEAFGRWLADHQVERGDR